ncbi:hypothetical protein N7465_002812 [Penicillium sp. CMV-2018d]|nr:hypothetical protein N7465_002812 [Penicillium sp. CMV-2018d]
MRPFDNCQTNHFQQKPTGGTRLTLLVIHDDNNGTLGITNQKTSETTERQPPADILAIIGRRAGQPKIKEVPFDKRPIPVKSTAGQRDGWYGRENPFLVQVQRVEGETQGPNPWGLRPRKHSWENSGGRKEGGGD